MNRLTWASGLLVATALVASPAVASAQVDQLIGVQAGGFFPRAEGSRVTGDVLNENLIDFSFDPAGPGDNVGRGIEAFRGGNFGGEYLIGFGDWVEAGVSVMWYQKSINSQYRDFTLPGDVEIMQRFKLNIVPVTASARWFPTGRTTPVQAYVGAGINFYKWKYNETGDFIDFTNPNANPLPVFNDTFEDDGTAVGPVVLGGLRIPFSHNHFLVGAEFRYGWGTADLDPSLNFSGNKLDLGGASAAATFHVRF
jgi:Outer membrane protein beta-barrel domain